MIVDKTCWRCRRPRCKAEQLGRTAMLLGLPESMRMRVTTEQDECDYYRRRLAEVNR